MKILAPQLELRACADAFNLVGERGVDGARVVAEMAAAMQREREAREWAEKMQRKLSECPGFVGCHPPGEASSGSVTVHPGAADEAMDFLQRTVLRGAGRLGQRLGFNRRGLAPAQGITRQIARRKLAPIEQFQFQL